MGADQRGWPDDFLPKPRVASSWHRATLRRQTPKVGAVCGNSAHAVLCGERASNAASLVHCALFGEDNISSKAARKAVSLMRPFGQRTCAVDLAPLLRAPLLMPDGIQGRGLPLIRCTGGQTYGALRCSSPEMVAKSERLDSWNRRVQGHLGCELCERSAKAKQDL